MKDFPLRIFRRLLIAGLLAGAWSLAVSGHAHHAFAAVFDRDTPIQLNGTVTRVDWMNPHVWFYIDVKTDSGAVENWGLEMGSPNSLVRRGWRSSTLESGSAVSVQGYRAKDGSMRGAVETVTLASGERLFGAQNVDR
jgi:hypothetical protein